MSSHAPVITPRVAALAFSLVVIAPVVTAQVTCPSVTPISGTNQVTTTNYFYDANGNRTNICDPNLNQTTHAFDVLNRLDQVVQPVPGSTGSHPVITTSYDLRNQVVSVTDPRSLPTTYTIDGLGNMTVLTSRDTGVTTNTYDALGNLRTSTDARTDETTYVYDALNRVTSATYASGTATTFTYDGGSTPVQYDIGHLTGIADESGSTRLYYDGFGRVLQKVQTSGTNTNSQLQTQTVTYTYSETGPTTGKLTSLTYPSGSVATYTYDAAGRVSSITLQTATNGSTTTVTLLSSVVYNPFGAPKSWTWGNGAAFTRTFDYDGRLNQYQLGNTTGMVTPNGLTRAVTYDPASRITAFVHTDTNGSTTSPVAVAANQSFGYDNINRLTSFTPATASQDQTYTYDLTGNRTGLSIGTTAYTDTISTTSNQLTGTNGPAPNRTNIYDADGNLTGDGTYTYAYSARGRVTSTTEGSNAVSYLYNGIGQRTYKTGPTTLVPGGANHYVYDEAGHLLGEYDVNGQTLQETVYLGSTPVGVMTPNAPVIVVDNTTPGETMAVGTWTASTAIAGYLGPNDQYHNATSGTDSFTWSVPIATSGSYNVYARWTIDSNRSTAATYKVGSNAVVHKNQQVNNGVWELLGTYTLAAGTTNVVLTPDTSGYVIADAVKAVPAAQDGITAYYIYPDQIDTPRIITRPIDNQMVWSWSAADPFGSATPNSNPSSLGVFNYNPRFPGQLFDDEDNLNYNYFRSYDPTLGRYVESDPIGLKGGINTYAYVGGNPLTRFDFLGLEERIGPKAACELLKQGYNPKDDECGCQKKVLEDLCDCYKDHSSPIDVLTGKAGKCVIEAYQNKTNCISNSGSCAPTACSGGGGPGNG